MYLLLKTDPEEPVPICSINSMSSSLILKALSSFETLKTALSKDGEKSKVKLFLQLPLSELT
jgi:hypothetical protein